MDQDFFVQAIIYLGSAVLMVPIAKRFGLGSVLGYLIAGVIIGPSAFGWIGHNGSDIMHFAEMGVVMMLFLIGLEVEPKLLWRWRRAIYGTACRWGQWRPPRRHTPEASQAPQTAGPAALSSAQSRSWAGAGMAG